MIENILLSHFDKYPKATVQDFYKLLYQNEFGGGHLITDPVASLERIKAEAAVLSPRKLAVEPIGNGLARLYLAPNPVVSFETINRLFCHSAKQHTGSLKSFEGKLAVMALLAKDGKLPFSQREAENYISEYKAKGFPMVSHSPWYREQYQPAYRIVRQEFLDFLPLYAVIEENLDHSFTIAIEGGSASGKTTLAKCLALLYDCNVFHADDFFLQSFQRTPERLGEIGGNIDYERLENQVIQGLQSGKSFEYHRYECQTGKMSAPILVAPKKLNIVEGVYSTHPNLTNIYDWKVFVRVTRSVQKQRLENRNPPALVKRFLEEWIPMENRYFKAYKIEEKANQIF